MSGLVRVGEGGCCVYAVAVSAIAVCLCMMPYIETATANNFLGYADEAGGWCCTGPYARRQKFLDASWRPRID